MLKQLGRVFWELFPAEWCGSPQAYQAQTLELPELKARVVALRAAAATADLERLKEFRDIATGRIVGEDGRQSSIIGRAQGLFVALALFGILFTFGASFFSQTIHIKTSLLWACFALVLYILAQMIIMVVSILKAIGGIHYPTFGTSDLTNWLGLASHADFYREHGLLTLEHYRVMVLNNNWRFERLGYALKGLRNIVFALSTLVAVLFLGAIVAQGGAAIKCVEDTHWWCS